MSKQEAALGHLDADEVKLIREHRRKKKYGEADQWKPREASDFDTHEKCHHFDVLHEMALNHFKDVKEKHYADEDVSQWVFEAVMGLLGTNPPDEPNGVPAFWKAYNAYLK